MIHQRKEDIPRNTAESTGKFPPTPILQTAAREHKVTYPGESPAPIANTPVIKRVILKAHLCRVNRPIHDSMIGNGVDVLPTPNIRGDPPERCAHKKANILPEFEPRTFETELAYDGRENEARDNLKSASINGVDWYMEMMGTYWPDVISATRVLVLNGEQGSWVVYQTYENHPKPVTVKRYH